MRLSKKMAVSYAALFLGLAACSPSSDTPPPVNSTAQQTSGPEETTGHVKYSAEAFFQTTSVSLARGGYAFSHDNEKLLISSDKDGVFNAALLDGTGGTTPLTSSAMNAHFAVSFFPADDRVLVTADSGGDELNHIYVREQDGALKDLTPGENVKANFGGFSGDDGVFYIWTNERDPAAFDLYAYDTDDYSRERLFDNTDFGPGDISNDGRWLVLDKSETSANSDVYLVDLTGADKTPQLITAHEGNIAYGSYAFTPDSKSLIYATNEHGEFNQAWRHDLATGEKSPLITADWDVSFVSYSRSGRYRIHAVNADGLTELSLLDTTTNQAVALPGVPKGELSQVRFSRDESEIALGVNSDTAPVNIYRMKLGQSAVQLTSALNAEIDETNLVTATVERFESFDGTVVPGIVYKPKMASAATPVPAIVMVHGGPGGQSTRGYNPMVQHLVNHGYAVYAANNRGSSGYGKTFFHMDDKRHGEEDLRDIVEAGNYLRGLDWVDGEKVAVMGGSYGGYMTAAALTFHPEAFDVGINIFGVTNWVRTLKSIPPWWGSFRDALYDEMGDPATDAERHRAISPLFHAERVVKPLLVVQGANDPRVLQVESDELVAAVRKNGTPVEYVIFPDEGHGFLRKENRITASDSYIDFLDKYLKGEGAQ